MPLKTVDVMNANAIELALDNWQDATGFIQIMDANNLTDWLINAPIIVNSLTNNIGGDTALVVEPSEQIKLGMLVYCGGYDTFGVVVNIAQVFSTPRAPFVFGYQHLARFAQYITPGLAPPAPIPDRILPPTGKWVSTNVTVTPALDTFMVIGSPVTFAIAAPTRIVIPVQPTSRGAIP